MSDRFRDLVLLIAGVFAGAGGCLIHDFRANLLRSDERLIFSGAVCCAIAAILLFQLYWQGRDPREPNEE